MATKKQQLRQEAAAWRKLAEWCDGNEQANEGLCYLLGTNVTPSGKYRARMRERIGQHAACKDMTTTGYLGPYFHHTGYHPVGPVIPTPHARILFCLFAAIECEEEARA